MISYHEKSEVIISVGDVADLNVSPVRPANGSGASNHSVGGRILCMVISALYHHGERAKNVNNTWGKRCDKLIFLTSRKAYNLSTILMPESIQDTYNKLWEKVTYGMAHAYSKYFDFDWFLKADDDTYVVMENLRKFLSGYNTSKPLLLGCRLDTQVDNTSLRIPGNATNSTFMSGGAGYVLSREALRLFVEVAHQDPRCVDRFTWAEDINMGQCLESANVTLVDTRDYFGRARFLPLTPRELSILQPRPVHDNWYNTLSHYRVNDGRHCCAESAISFHYVVRPMMDLMEFFLYHLSPNQHY
ncbi:hypothetical protein GE061_006538 [Apolygus lucorum]|uniref:N-acetylgalactosaminide beta-1,3-galactosyltransferase n=1 Tax=Apolygus lucorum TaxID=248454 RepID=A0A6A4IZN2_APOLU|nr:hypothetical protein GE061_006538 [Apolygus lucorum]